MHISGSVQGIGFRPFIYRLAHAHQLVGCVLNTNQGVSIDIQGEEANICAFRHALHEAKPKRALIAQVDIAELPLHQTESFEILTSQSLSETSLALLPDTAICSLCLQELFCPDNRRFSYPFIHCTHCGPRFSLFERMPFDRGHTTMVDFPMCAVCLKEYHEPDDRRFYAQTNCCPACGPKLKLLTPRQEVCAEGNHAITGVVDALLKGKIVAIKNTGGYLLLVDATNESSVRRLRIGKKRAKKPFALLMQKLAHIQHVASLSSCAENVLTSPAAPIVLLEKQKDCLAPSVTCESPYYGIMLPHTPLQHLLLAGVKRPLVATSGNLSDYPLCITEAEAFSQLSTIADLFLTHNRRIIHRLDDSVVHIIAGREMVMRRARGYIPYALSVPYSCQRVLGVGGHQKSSFALYTNQHIYLSQHLGDLDSTEACSVYDQEVKSWEHLLNMTPDSGVGDHHPSYYSTTFLQKKQLKRTFVPHHQAHVLSCLLDNQLFFQPLLCFAWDGTGWGEDHTIWGGEVFLVKEKGMKRCATLYPFQLPGGEKAIREPRRAALGALFAYFGQHIPQTEICNAFTSEEYRVLVSALAKGINSPACTSMGRLFDVVSALVGCCMKSQYEGEAALLLEGAARLYQTNTSLPSYKLDFIHKKDLWVMDWRPMLQQILEDHSKQVPVEAIALAFHQALAKGMVELAHKASLKKILLTGGVMQNKLLTECAIDLLRNEGFEPFWHHHIPPNDGGLAAGQVMGRLLCV